MRFIIPLFLLIGCETETLNADYDTEDTGIASVEDARYIGTLSGPDIWIFQLDENGKRRSFMKVEFFYTWEDSIDGVRMIKQRDLDSIPTASSMTVKPGVVLLTVDDSYPIYWIEEDPNDPYGAIARPINDESVVADMIGPYWPDYVLDINRAHFYDYTVGSEINSSKEVVVDRSKLKRSDELYENAY